MAMDPPVEEDNVEEVVSDDISIGRTFGDGNEAYNAYSSYALAKGFEICRNKITMSGTDEKDIWREFVCNKEGQKLVIKDKSL